MKVWCLVAGVMLAACGGSPGTSPPDGGSQAPDAGIPDAGGPDGGPVHGSQEAAHWSAQSVPGAGTLYGVWGSAPTDVWAVGEAGLILHWDGTRWAQEARVPASIPRLQDVWGSSAQDVWAVGQAGVILHFNGQEWQLVEFGEAPFCESGTCGTGGINALWGSSATDVWAVGSSLQGRGVISHWDGAKWSHAVQDGTARLQGLWGSGATDVWAGGLTQLLHWNGTAWQVRATSTPTSSVATKLWGAEARDVWGVSLSGEIFHWDGTRWSEVALADEDRVPLRAIAGADARRVWAIGGVGGTSSSRTLLYWEGSAWQRVRQEAGPALEDIWVAPGGEAWAVGGQGSLLHRLP